MEGGQRGRIDGGNWICWGVVVVVVRELVLHRFKRGILRKEQEFTCKIGRPFS